MLVSLNACLIPSLQTPVDDANFPNASDIEQSYINLLSCHFHPFLAQN
jgi:hypothetical protein